MKWISSDWVGHKDKRKGKKHSFSLPGGTKAPSVLQGQDFQKNTCVCLCVHGGVRVHSYAETSPPQPGLCSVRSTDPPPSAHAKIKSAALGEPSPKSLCGGQHGQLDFLSERGLWSHPKPPLAITKANFFWAVRPQVLLLALAVAACGSHDGHP